MNDQKNNQNEEIKDSFQIDEATLEELRKKAREKAKNTFHNWRQKGNYIVCKSCEFPHRFNIGVDKMLVGITDEGLPILKDRGK